MEKTAMKVGHIPSLTWNRLEANEGTAPAGLAASLDVETRFEKLPEGVTHRRMSGKEAAKWLEKHAPEEKAEAIVAGKVPIYHPQRFGTGLGAEYDAFLEKSGTVYEMLEVAPDTRCEEPVVWSVDFYDGNEASQGQLIRVGENSHLTLLLRAASGSKGKGTAAFSTKIILEKGASLFLVKAQILGEGYTFLDDTGAALAEGASMKMVQIELGGGRVYIGTQPELIGDRSSFEAHAGYLGNDRKAIDVNYNAIQRGRRTDVKMSFDGVLKDRSEKAFRGTIDFKKGAVDAVGSEQETVLMLGDDVVNKTVPLILCAEENVEGNHGASIGELDGDTLFYFESRGISREAAENIMARAAIERLAESIGDEAAKEYVLKNLEEEL